jgi:hypothetical protein
MEKQSKENLKETLLDNITEIFSVGINVCDAMKKVASDRPYTARICLDEMDWILETTDNPRRIITITLME